MQAEPRVSLYDDGAPAPCPAPFNLADHVLNAAAAKPLKTALAIINPTGAEQWSYARLRTAVGGMAAGLLDLGFVPGDRVLMRLGNTVDFPITFLAAIAADLVPVPTSALLTVPEVTRLAASIAPALIVADDGIALPEAPSCPVLTTAEAAAMHSLPPAPFVMGDPGRPGYIVHTSGTSGQPRAVLHAHRAVWARRMMMDGWYGLSSTDRVLHAGAFNWTYTLGTGLLDPWAVGATALIPAPDVTPAQLPPLIARFGVTILAAAPGLYRRLLRAPMPPCPKLRHGLSAGEKLPEATRTAWIKATKAPIFEAYGMSECSTFVSGSPARPAPDGTLGYPQPGRRVAVLGPDGPVARNTPGALGISNRDQGLMLGYFGAEDETRACFQGEWFLTGDLASMGKDGALRYLGRSDDMMNAGGVRVSPIEVEAVLSAHPDIEECAAVEIAVRPDVTVIGLFYTSTDDPGAEALGRFAAGRLARYKCPRIYNLIKALPKGPNDKLLRRQLRRSWEASLAQA